MDATDLEADFNKNARRDFESEMVRTVGPTWAGRTEDESVYIRKRFVNPTVQKELFLAKRKR